MIPAPPGLPLELDRSVRVMRGGTVLVGGDPPRAIRLSPAGARALARMRTVGPGESMAARQLARTLVDGGLAHPTPAAVARASDATVVIPVRDRTRALDRCLAHAGERVIVVDDGSRDPGAIANVCERHGARLIRRGVAGGPALARNAAIEEVDTALVAFLDSDCVAPTGWVDRLAGHFDDPAVAAVAPRVRGATPPSGAGAVGRFAAARSPLDLGDRAARVAPGRRVAYVPTAALVVRRDALGDGFDPALRYGEDVDFVWRLHETGHTVRYDPTVVVEHHEPSGLAALLTRRFHHGTAAAPLATRHPGRLAPLIVDPCTAAVVGLALLGRPRPAVALAAWGAYSTIRRTRAVGVPPARAATWPFVAAGRTALAAGRAAATLTPPVLMAAGLAGRRRGTALALLTAAPLGEWVSRRPALDPARYVAMAIAGDAAYGAGVWTGCVRERNWEPLRPTVQRWRSNALP